MCPVHPVHPVQASNGAASSWTGHTEAVPSVLSKAPTWTDLDGWRSLLGQMAHAEDRRDVVSAWATAASGWSDAAAIYLPACLPAGLAFAELKAHARALRFDVREDHDDPEHTRWLQAAPEAPPGPRPVCEHCLHFRQDDGPKLWHLCRRGGACLTQRQAGECGPAGRLWQVAS
jgi:hypothetical protein